MSIVETVFKPDVAAWKALVRESDEIPPPETLDKYKRSSVNFFDDSGVLRKREQAHDDLKRADEIDAEAAKIEVPRPVDYREMLVADVKTIGDLIDFVELVKNPYQVVPNQKIRKNELTAQARQIRNDALRVLTSTADPEIAEKIRNKQEYIRDLQQRITHGQPANAQGEAVQLLQDRLDALVRGKPHPDNRVDAPPEQLRQAIETSLATFPTDAIRRGKQATKSNAKAEREIAAAQREIGKLQEQGRKLDCMRWSE